MSRLEYKGYAGSIEYSVVDHCWHGEVLGLTKNVCILYEGNTIEELYNDFQEGIDHYLDDCKGYDIHPEMSNTKIQSAHPSASIPVLAVK